MDPDLRRGRDSNPRCRFTPHAGLANRYLRPLGHLSRCLWSDRVGLPRGLATPSGLVIYSVVRSASSLAEEEGFEPPELALGGFQDRCLRPLGHSSGLIAGGASGEV